MKSNFEKAKEKIERAVKENLSYLDFSYWYLNELPEEIGEAESLIDLNLSNNYLFSLPDSISKLKRLRTLNLSYNNFNGINSLPFSIEDHLSLTEIDLTGNNLVKFPEEVLSINTLEYVSLDDNPIQEIVPPEIWESGIDAVNNFLYSISISKNTKQLNEVKLILLGDGDVGKTTLMNKITDINYKAILGQEATTHGIYIKEWKTEYQASLNEVQFYANYPLDAAPHTISQWEYLKDEREEEEEEEEEEWNIESSNREYLVNTPISINMWDFGGQDIYLSTHQFFLTKRSIYIFVWEARKDQDYHGFEKWLNTIKYLSDNSPVLVVMNKCDSRYAAIDELSLKNKFSNIVGFSKISCLENIGIEEIKNSIKSIIPNLTHVSTRLPNAWFDLKTRLKEDLRNFISYSEFIILSSKYGFDEKRANFFSEYLHDLGIILHFQGDRFLENLLILKPGWLTKAVYALIDNKQTQLSKGKFTINTFKEILDSHEYPRDTHESIIKLMEKFELCFNIIGTDGFILSALLPIGDTIFLKEATYKNVDIRMNIEYEFMPSGVIARLLCRMHYLLHADKFWKNWLELKYEGSIGVIVQDLFHKRLCIYIKGVNSSDLLALIRSHLDQIHRLLNLNIDVDYSENIPCNCITCINSTTPYFFRYDVLRRFIEKEKNIISCQTSTEEVEIHELLKKYLKKTPKQNKILDVIVACNQLQGQHKIILSTEDARNSFISNVLINRSINAKDQSRWGKSSSGKGQGELDIKIESETGVTQSIIEGFNLTYFNRTVIISHYTKIFDYDANGLKENFLISYVTSSSFITIWQQYQNLINTTPVQYEIQGIFEDITDKYECGTDVRIGFTKHLRQGQLINMYHVFIKIDS